LARKIYEINHISELLMAEFRDLGLLDDPELLRDLELIYLDGTAARQQRETFRKQFRK
jgi:hypothetical protein